MSITAHATVDEFFRDILQDALSRQGVSASEPTEFYLVGLLGEYAKGRVMDRPLSLHLVESGHKGTGERVKALKEVGDTSLYVTGFFADSLERKLVGVDYYVDLGQAAYGELATRLQSSTVAEIYDELSDNFPRFVDVLGEIRRHVSFAGSDVVRLYEEWTRNRSDWVEARLRALGVVVGGADDDGAVH